MNSPTSRLAAGLLFTLLVIGGYAAYTLHTVSRMREVQAGIVDRNRRGALQLIRIQSDLNALALAMRDMLDNPDGLPLSAWKAPLERIRQNLDDAISKEAELAAGRRTEQSSFLRSSFQEFWRAAEEMLRLSAANNEAGARQMVRAALQPRQEALTALTARLLIESNDDDLRAGEAIGAIYADVEANVYRLLGVSVVLILLTGAGLIHWNRTIFSRLEGVAEQRRHLARQLIETQESTYRTISRDLHDEFGQILTALGAMLRRADRHAPSPDFRSQVQEVAETVQSTLEKIRSLSQSLQPVILQEQGLAAAVDWHLQLVERQTGIRVHYQPPAAPVTIPEQTSIHIFRILQEALNNVVRHANVEEVNIDLEHRDGELRLSVADSGRGLPDPIPAGVGTTAMRERAELIGGRLEIVRRAAGGTAVHLSVPVKATPEVPVAQS